MSLFSSKKLLDELADLKRTGFAARLELAIVRPLIDVFKEFYVLRKIFVSLSLISFLTIGGLQLSMASNPLCYRCDGWYDICIDLGGSPTQCKEEEYQCKRDFGCPFF